MRFFSQIYVQKRHFLINIIIMFNHSLCLFSPSSSVPPQKNSSRIYYNTISLPWALFFLLLLEHLFCLSHRKACWTMSMDNVGLEICLMGTSNSMVTLPFFPWCRPKWSRDEFNNQSHILQCHGPWCKQPLRWL